MYNASIIPLLIVLAVVFLNLTAILLLIRELLTGSYKQYVQKRELHMEQLRRIERSLREEKKDA